MIPKVIHFCWLSDDAYPEKIQMCIDSWKRILPDYEIVHWNFSRFPRGTSKWVDQAFDNHKYAFAADYIRLYALYHYGGIYLDSDVEVLKSFDDLLHLPYFMGKEPSPSGIEAAVMGAEKGNLLIKSLLDSYEGKDFVQPDGKFDIQPIPFKFRACIESQYLYHPIESIYDFSYDNGVINVFPVDFFSPKDFKTSEIHLTERTYCIHHFSASWLKNSPSFSTWKEKVKDGLKKIINWKTNQVLLSNSNIDTMYDSCFSTEKHSCLYGARVSTEDFLRFLTMREQWSGMELVQIQCKSSKYADKIKTFYPITRIKGTDLEIHFVNCYSFEQVQKLWQDGIANMLGMDNYMILSSNDIMAIRDFCSLTKGKGLVLTTLKDIDSKVKRYHVDTLDVCNEKCKGRDSLLLKICFSLLIRH